MPVLENARHEKFAQEVARGAGNTEAYKLAGYDVSSDESAGAAGARLLADVRVRERVNELLERSANKASLSKAWVLERLMRNAQIALGEQPVTLTMKRKGESQPTELTLSDRDATAANKALELLGREQGMFIERKEVGQPGEFERLNDNDLRDIITAANLGASSTRSSGADQASGARGVRSKPN